MAMPKAKTSLLTLPPLCTHKALWESGCGSHALPVGYEPHSQSDSFPNCEHKFTLGAI